MVRILLLAGCLNFETYFALADTVQPSVRISVGKSLSASFGSTRIVAVAADKENKTVTFKMDDNLSHWFKEISEQNIGTIATVAICDKVLLRARISGGITEGIIQVSRLSERQQSKLVDVMSGQAGCE